MASPPRRYQLENTLAWNLLPSWQGRSSTPVPTTQPVSVTTASRTLPVSPTVTTPSVVISPLTTRSITVQTSSPSPLVSTGASTGSSHSEDEQETTGVSLPPLRHTPVPPALTQYRPVFAINSTHLKTALQQLVCQDTNNFANDMSTLSCGHVTTCVQHERRTRKKTRTPVSFRCPVNACGALSNRTDKRDLSRLAYIREIVRGLFNPQPVPPYFTATEARRLFEQVCQQIEQHTAPLENPTADAVQQQIELAVEAAVRALSAGSPTGTRERIISIEPRLITTTSGHSVDTDQPPIVESNQQQTPDMQPEPETPLSPPKSKKKKASLLPCPYLISTTITPHWEPLKGTNTPDGQLVIVHEIPKHQPNFLTAGQLRFIEYLPNDATGQRLAKRIKAVALAGGRFHLSSPEGDTRIISWNSAIPSYTNKRYDFPYDLYPRLQRALESMPTDEQ